MKGHRHSEETKKKLSLLGMGRKLSAEAKEKIAFAHLGKKLPPRTEQWRRRLSVALMNYYDRKGRIKTEDESIRKTLEYRLWREAVFKRDKYTCLWCGAKSGSGKTVVLNADHIKPFYLFPEFRFAIDNGRTLCIDCHRKTSTYGRPKQTS